MKILNVIPRYPPAIGGSETWCREFCRFLAGRGVITQVATMNLYNVAEAFEKGFTREEFIALGKEDYDKGVFIKRYDIWAPWMNLPSAKIINRLTGELQLDRTQVGDVFKTSPNSLQMYRALFKDTRDFDVIALHTLPYFHNLVGFLAAKIYRKKVIMIPHFHPGHGQFERNIFFKAMNNCDAVIAVSEYEKRYLMKKGVAGERIFVFGNAINPDLLTGHSELPGFKKALLKEHDIDEKNKKIIFIGRKEVYKGVFFLIEALNRLVEEESVGLDLFLVGPDTPDFNRIYPSAYKSERLKVVNFGVVSDEFKENLVKVSDLLVLPSKFEAFGIAFLEAWKHEKPVVGMDLGAVPAVIDGAGLCAEPGNADDLKNKIKKLLFDEKLARKMGLAGRRKVVNKYSTERVYGKSLNIFSVNKGFRKKVLIVSHLFPPYFIGGSELAAYEQSKVFRKLGWEVEVFAGKIDDSEGRFCVTKENNGFKVTRINMHGRDFYHDKYANFYREGVREAFRKHLHGYGPDIAHFHNIYGFSIDMIDDCYNLCIPTVMTLHDYWGICPKNLLLDKSGNICLQKDHLCVESCQEPLFLEDGNTITAQERNLKLLDYYKKIDLLISPSKCLAERFIEKGVPREKFKIIKYGIDLSRFNNPAKRKSTNRKLRIGFIGQIIWHKGIDVFFEALSLLNIEEQSKISVLIVGTGEGPYLSYCKDLVRDLDFVKFAGRLNNNKTQKFYRNIDIAVIPSRWPENSPIVIQEAQACGVPVIGSNVPGVTELVEHEETGFIFNNNDAVDMSEKIRKVIKNPDMLLAMRTNCIEMARRNDLTEQVRLIADNYRTLLEMNGSVR